MRHQTYKPIYNNQSSTGLCINLCIHPCSIRNHPFYWHLQGSKTHATMKSHHKQHIWWHPRNNQQPTFNILHAGWVKGMRWRFSPRLDQFDCLMGWKCSTGEYMWEPLGRSWKKEIELRCVLQRQPKHSPLIEKIPNLLEPQFKTVYIITHALAGGSYNLRSS